jgi:hypothetical protein
MDKFCSGNFLLSREAAEGQAVRIPIDHVEDATSPFCFFHDVGNELSGMYTGGQGMV